MNQKQWEQKGWILPEAPRGWFQWYCDLYCGRPTYNDEYYIKKWINFVRWTKHPESPVIAQSLLHWAYRAKSLRIPEL